MNYTETDYNPRQVKAAHATKDSKQVQDKMTLRVCNLGWLSLSKSDYLCMAWPLDVWIPDADQIVSLLHPSNL